ncbi:putative membrane protein [Chlamydia psittaci CP3]|nr:putative membrane protein [Chlamydia psittaci 84/55]AFS22628.1 putative membrane protein [Chlamydia psittaci VS225]AFS25988.1 putative membrane protein [Chlamydia psittaci WC]AFS26869.1 putative membrane protein [Chlamydia psittaci CP3]EGF85000.1 putative membrane protein [Chlamydia psittaci Cal10]EPJ15490.1 putative membrane protein [Chlamydia psittaci 02DC18]EPJ16844.1 putative membrane protein [Chlamydia psittaci 02DC22]EPJ18845.1 putative membrane protein [Chlamydia psittaci 01DC11]E
MYDRAIRELKQEESRLQKRVSELQEKIFCAEEEQKELRLHIQCWDNPVVIESALIRRLGLIPKGYTKICFSPVIESKSTD